MIQMFQLVVRSDTLFKMFKDEIIEQIRRKKLLKKLSLNINQENLQL